MAAKKKSPKSEERGRRAGKMLRCAVLLGAVAAAAVKYSTLDVSRKRFIKHLLKQVPYMPARYFA